MAKTRFAIVGSGYIGLRHAAVIVQNPDAQLVAMIDIDHSLKDKVADRFAVPFFSDLEEMIAAGVAPDVVNVCTPNGSHASESIKAVEAGFHVVCEKPLGLNRAECEELLHKSLQHNRLVFGVMQNRYSPPSAWLKEIVTTGVLGAIYMVEVNCFWNRDDRYYSPGGWKGTMAQDGGTLFTQFSHFVDIMYWLFGDIRNISARFESFNHKHLTEFEDSGIVTFDFVKGGMGSINFSTSVWDKNMESSITIIAERGSVKVGGQYMDKVEYCHVKNYSMPELAPVNPPNDYGPYKGSAANHHYVIQNVIETLQHRNSATTNALEGMKVVEIIERIYEHRKR
jgi:predicted dehydrogenase